MIALQAWILFSGKQFNDLNKILQQKMYNRVRKSDYHCAAGYLDGLEITHEHYRDLLLRFLNQEKTLLVLDPPYIQTSQGCYRQDNYFGVADFISLMTMIRPPFILFSSEKSETKDYIDTIIEAKTNGYKNFESYQKIEIAAPLNKDVKYKDYMIFKF